MYEVAGRRATAVEVDLLRAGAALPYLLIEPAQVSLRAAMPVGGRWVVSKRGIYGGEWGMRRTVAEAATRVLNGVAGADDEVASVPTGGAGRVVDEAAERGGDGVGDKVHV